MRNLGLFVAAAVLLWAGSEVGQCREPTVKTTPPSDQGSGKKSEQQSGQSSDIKAFVRELYIHGVPYEEASRYDTSVVPTLLEMLNDPREQDYWSNIVVTLAIVGDESTLEPISEFIRKGEQDTLTPGQYRAKKSAVMALGYLLNKSGSQKILEYLKTFLEPRTGSEKGFKWAAPNITSEEQNRDLGKHAILGLALSGHPKAAEVLESIKRLLTTGTGKLKSSLVAGSTSRSELSGLVSEALRTHREIIDLGLAKYYRKLRP